MRAVVTLDRAPAGAPRAVGPLTIVADDRGVAERLASRLDRRGLDVRVAASAEELDGTTGVVFLGGLRRLADTAEARALHRDALACAKRAALDVAWMTVTALGGDHGLSGAPDRVGAFVAGLAGFTKTVALEHPSAFVRALDLADADPDALAARIDAEIGHAGPVEIGVPASGERLTLVTEPAPLPPVSRGPQLLGTHDVIVVSGGARGVTAACLIALAMAWRPRFVLLGRSRIDDPEPSGCEGVTDEPGLKRALFTSAKGLTPAEIGRRVSAILAAREARANIAAMEAAGSAVRYVAVDVQDAAAVSAALAPIRAAWGPITGLVHGAGVIHDKRVKDKTLAQFDAVLDTKLGGLLTLLDATAGDPLKALVLFSSVAARSGNVGQSDYALANEALNRVAASEAARRPGCVVRSIGWGPWEGGMVTPALAKQFHAAGVPLLPIDAGADTFVRELAAGPGPVESIVGGEIVPSTPKGATAPPPATRVTRALQASAARIPQLADHALSGTPVLPAVMAVDALLQAADALRPGQIAALTEVRVLKGVPLPGFQTGSDALEAVVDVDGDHVALTLRGAGGALHYRARATLGDRGAAPAAPAPVATQPWPKRAREVYASHDLFHGPAFRAIDTVRVGEGGLDATLLSGAALGWPSPAGPTDVALMDGAVQLAALWTRHLLGGASLPTSIGEVRVWRLPDPVLVRAAVRPVRATRASTVTDLTLSDTRGVFAVLSGVELHALPSGAYPRGGTPA